MDSNQSKTGVALVVMGPSACGKSEVASALSKQFKCEYIDADCLHSPANIEKMGKGIPLTDQDRFPWLNTVRGQLVKSFENKIASTKPVELSMNYVNVVVACSALKKTYREILRGNFEGTVCSYDFKTIFIFLDCSENVLADRISGRKGHFMKANMLQSQLNTLEKPDADELAVTVNGDQSLTVIVTTVVENLAMYCL